MAVDFVDVGLVAAKMKMLASDYASRPTIVQEPGVLKAIVHLCTESREEPAQDALAALRLLAAHPDNHTPLAENAEVTAKLREVIEGDWAPARREMASDLLERLEQGARPVLGDLTNKNGNAHTSRARVTKQGGKTTAKPETLFIIVEALKGDGDKDKLEKFIITTKGVISVNFDKVEMGEVTKDLEKVLTVRAVVLTRTPPEELIARLTSEGFKASIAKDVAIEGDKDGRRRRSILQTPTCAGEKQSEDSPQYLTPPDMLEARDDAVVATGDGGALQNRLEEQKRRQENTGGWLKKVGRALWLV